MKEHLVHIILAKGDFIDFYKDTENGQISLCSQAHCASLPKLTGLETTELFGLLEPLGEKVEFPSDSEDITKPAQEGQKDVRIQDN
jgi:hypothetical protein